MLKLEGVHKSFRGNEVLHGVDAHFGRGVTVVIGPSGSGKSTLLRLLAGLEVPDAGRVMADGAVLDSTRMLAHRRRLGSVIQEGGLFPLLTARKNVTLMARYLKRDADWIESRLRALAGMTHLPPPCSTVTRQSFQAASANAWRWSGRWCSSPVFCCWTNRWGRSILWCALA